MGVKILTTSCITIGVPKVENSFSSANEHELNLLSEPETKLLYKKFNLEYDSTPPSEESLSATHFDLLKGHPLVIELIGKIRQNIPGAGSLKFMCSEIRKHLFER
jgi:hypothetical protein